MILLSFCSNCFSLFELRIEQIPNLAPILGEVAFFLAILQPMTVRARPDGDVQLLVLTREDSNELFNNYPEQVSRLGRFFVVSTLTLQTAA